MTCLAWSDEVKTVKTSDEGVLDDSAKYHVT